MLTIANKGTYLVKNWQKYANVIYERPLKQSYIPHLKVLMCGINASSPQWQGCIFIKYYNHMTLALLLHKTATAKYILHSTVTTIHKFSNFLTPLPPLVLPVKT